MKKSNSKLRIRFFGAACLTIETNDCKILCDPWFSDGAFEGSWNRIEKPSNPVKDIGKVNYIYISHIHPDHYDKVFLKEYLNTYKNVEIIIPKPKNINFLEKKITKDGFNSTSTNELFINNTHIQIRSEDKGGTSDIDSLLVVKHRDKVCVNTNDMNLNHNDIQFLEKFEIDILCCKYCFPGPWPALFDLDESEKIIEKKLHIERGKNNFKNLMENLKPKITVPIAASSYWASLNKDNEKYRATYDALDLKKIYGDKVYIPREDGKSIISLNKTRIETSFERNNKLKIPIKNNSLYTHQQIFSPTISNELSKYFQLEYLMNKAFINACEKTKKIKIDGKLVIFSSSITGLISFGEEKNIKIYENYEYKKAKELIDSFRPNSSLINIETSHLLSLLLRISHWDNSIAGGIANFYRPKKSKYIKEHYDFLNFLYL